MEELGFFNEREAECFEREDTLSQTDLEKLNVAEDMPEMERAEHLLRSGLDRQKISVLFSLPKILASNNSKANLTIILDCIKGMWQKCEAEGTSHTAASAAGVLQLEIFHALSSLASATVDGKVLNWPTVSFHDEFSREIEQTREERANTVYLLTDEQVAKQLMPLALDLVSEIQQKELAEAASLAVIASLPRLNGTIKKTQFIRVAMDKGDVSQPPGSRLICCLLLGAVTAFNLLTPQDIEGLYLQKMMAMCQDTDAEVRKCMCIQLDALARAIGEEKAGNVLLPELLELLQDEEEQVKQAAFLALLSLLDFFPASERIKHVVPELQNIAERLPDYLDATFSEQFGILVTKLAGLNHLGNDVATSLLHSYSKLSSHEEPVIRQFCAYNFPAVVKAFGNQYLSALMDDLLTKLSQDAMDCVRLHIAAGLHEVALLVGAQRALRYLKPAVLALLKDAAQPVHGMILSRMPVLMSSTFAVTDNEEQKTAVLDATLKSITHYHGILPASRNRDQILFVESLMQYPSWCSSDQMYETVIPIVFELIEDGARPVQLLAIHTLIKCIRRNENPTHRFSLLSKLRTEYGHSRSYWRRLLYLEACERAVEINSRQYCRLNFVDIAIELLDDAVPNVRIKAASLVPQWKVLLTALSDEKMLERIKLLLDESAVDNDRDVANAIADARLQIETNELQHWRAQEDAEDKRRVAEEESLGLVSDHEDSSADSKWSSMLEYTLVVGKDGQVVRRARVKSLELANKLSGSRQPGKDTGRSNGTGSSNYSAGGGSTGLGMNGTGNAMGSLSKVDPNKTKMVPKTPTKPPSTSITTTLPNCAPARPPNATAVTTTKVIPAIKVAASAGKLNTSGSKSATGSSRSSAAIAKDVTKIPIIRPSAPAKRESSPSTGTKPTTITSVPASFSGAGMVGGSSTTGPQGSALVAATMKNKLGSLDSSSVGGGSAPPKPKVTPPASAATKR